jgi:hypothetical protein
MRQGGKTNQTNQVKNKGRGSRRVKGSQTSLQNNKTGYLKGVTRGNGSYHSQKPCTAKCAARKEGSSNNAGDAVGGYMSSVPGGASGGRAPRIAGSAGISLVRGESGKSRWTQRLCTKWL